MVESQASISSESARRPLFIGVDVGGTNTKIGVVDDQGRILEREGGFLGRTSIATYEERGAADAVQRIAVAIQELLTQLNLSSHDVHAIGLGTPGAQDIPRGIILDSPNMPHWRDFPIRDALASACNKPCAYVNDANAAAYGEFWVGCGRHHRSMVMFTLGTGVGGGIVLNDALVEGEHSFGSELGHLIIDSGPTARLCVWGGGLGQLEAYASASAVVARAEEALAAGAQSSLQARRRAENRLTAKMLFEEAEKGDSFSLDIILETAHYLGIGVTSIVHVLDPGLVVIGGAMTFGGHATRTGRAFLEAVRKEFLGRTFDVVAKTVIDYASLGADAGFIGAAGIGRKNFSIAKGQ